jgi:hypothetical protein
LRQNNPHDPGISAAQAVLTEAKAAVERRDIEAIGRLTESVKRTVKMFRGLVRSTGQDGG